MKKLTLSIVFIFCSYISLLAVTDSQYIKTTFTDGGFVTVCQKEVNSTGTETNAVINRMINEFHTKPMRLFDWALKDIGLQGQQNNEMIIIFKSSRLDKTTGITHGLVDVIIPNLQDIRDIEVNAIVKNEIQPNGQLIGSVDVLNSDFLIKKAYATITSIPLKNGNQLLKTETHIQFGWLLKFFITQNRYKNIVEWRIDKFIENMQKEAEKSTYSQTIY